MLDCSRYFVSKYIRLTETMKYWPLLGSQYHGKMQGAYTYRNLVINVNMDKLCYEWEVS